MRRFFFRRVGGCESGGSFGRVFGYLGGARRMCGIFAYINCNVSRERRHILEVLFNGLRRLEYRGYDSAGISIDADEDGDRVLHGLAVPALPPLVFREEGKIDKLVTSVYQGMVTLCFF